jgi:uncharacterized protein YceH (UPF0502 family)
MNYNNELPKLNEIEIRVLGSLIEKSKTTPDYYPMTLNALTAACNQKSSRHPVVDYDEETVVLALNQLKAQSLVAMAVGGSSRTNKYKHNFTTVFPLTDGELATMCLLFLRGALTPGEIKSNSGRLHEFHSLDGVHDVLQKLSSNEPSFIKELSKRAGQKETRYVQLFSEYIETEENNYVVEPARKSVSELDARVATLEKELQEVKEKLEKLMKELLG